MTIFYMYFYLQNSPFFQPENILIHTFFYICICQKFLTKSRNFVFVKLFKTQYCKLYIMAHMWFNLHIFKAFIYIQIKTFVLCVIIFVFVYANISLTNSCSPIFGKPEYTCICICLKMGYEYIPMVCAKTFQAKKKSYLYSAKVSAWIYLYLCSGLTIVFLTHRVERI